MDLPALLTLHVLRFVQMPLDRPASPVHWMFVPEGRRARWLEAVDLLAAAPKPLMVAPLLEPGFLGTWGVHALTGEYRQRADYELSNQVGALEHQMQHYGIDADANIVFDSPADRLSLPADEVRRWLQEYAVFVGWTLGEGPDCTHRARLLIRRPDGHWSPGAVCRTPRSTT